MPNHLKKKFTATLLILILSRFVIAQGGGEYNLTTPKQKRFSPIEILMGAGIVSLRQGPPDPHRQDVVDFGYAFGLARKYALTDYFQLEVKILYERKGGKQYDDEQTMDTVTHTNVIHKGAIITKHIYNSLTVPITACYYFGHKVRFQLKAGPYFSYALKAVTNTKTPFNPVNQPISFQYTNDITDLLIKYDLGYSLSIGMELPLAKENKISIQLISNKGLVNIAKPVNPAYPLDWKTNSLFIMIGLPLQSILNKQNR